MTIIDDRTANLNLPLPNKDNALEDDVARLRTALTTLDTAVNGKQASLGFTAENAANKGQANGYASLDGSGKVPAVQLPSFVDDVLEYANQSGFPGSGSSGVIYVAQDTNKVYRWSGSAYVEISPSPGSTDAVTEGSTNLYFTAARVRSAVLTGLTTVTAAAIAATDTVIGALQKLQAQVTANTTKLGSTAQGVLFTEVEITPSSNGQTSFAVSGGYTAGQVWILLNGIKLAAADFTATDGANVVLTTGANTTDLLTVVKFKQALVA